VRAEVVDLNIVKQIESAGNPLAVSRTGAIGLYQIMPCVLSEYNTFNKANHSRPELFNPQVNAKIAKWYLEVRIPQMLRHYGKEVNTSNCLIAYNAGIRAVVKGYLPRETANYLKKYARLTNA
jgi:soluble lytic murein transglycosylase-like protein